MEKYCNKCKKEFASCEKKCPLCGGKLISKYSEAEIKEIQKQNDDFTVINTFFM